jgi:hypothetical protein
MGTPGSSVFVFALLCRTKTTRPAAKRHKKHKMDQKCRRFLTRSAPFHWAKAAMRKVKSRFASDKPICIRDHDACVCCDRRVVCGKPRRGSDGARFVRDNSIGGCHGAACRRLEPRCARNKYSCGRDKPRLRHKEDNRHRDGSSFRRDEANGVCFKPSCGCRNYRAGGDIPSVLCVKAIAGCRKAIVFCRKAIVSCRPGLETARSTGDR